MALDLQLARTVWNRWVDRDPGTPGIQIDATVVASTTRGNIVLCSSVAPSDTAAACSGGGYVVGPSQPQTATTTFAGVSLADGVQQLHAELDDGISKSALVRVTVDSRLPQVQQVTVVEDANGDGRLSLAELPGTTATLSLQLSGADGGTLRLTTAAGAVLSSQAVSGASAQVSAPLVPGPNALVIELTSANGNPNISAALGIDNPAARLTIYLDRCGNGTCDNSEDDRVCPADCGNLLLNPSFEDDFTHWTPSTAGNVVIASGGIDGVKMAQVENTDDYRANVIQPVTFDPPTRSPFYFSSWSKADAVAPNALICLDVCVDFADGDVTCLCQQMKSTAQDAGHWSFKEMLFVPPKPVSRLRVIPINYYAKSIVDFDDLMARPVAPGIQSIVDAGATHLTLNSNGYTASLTYDGSELLGSTTAPLCQLVLENGTTAYPTSMQALGNGYYQVEFANTDDAIEITVRAEDGVLVFSLADVIQPDPVERVDFANIVATHVVQLSAERDWVVAASSDTPIQELLPLNPATVTWPDAGGYHCEANRWMGFAGASCALVVSNKAGLYDAIEALITRRGLPNVQIDGQWLRKSDLLQKSYLFASVTHDNHLQLLDDAKRGGFAHLLMISPVVPGQYTEPRPSSFASRDQFFSDMDAFKAAGIEIGLHTLLSHVIPSDPLFSLDNLLQIPIATLNAALGASDTAASLDTDLSTDPTFVHYSTIDWRPSPSVYFRVDDELLRCASAGTQLTTCQRGQATTTAASHAVGATVSIVPYSEGAFWLDMTQPSVRAATTAGFADVANRLGITFLYADGYSYVPLPGMDSRTSDAYRFANGIEPYLDALNQPVTLETGSGAGAFSWYYRYRGATNDGVVFKAKQFTRDYKVPLMASDSPYGWPVHEMGWWKFFGTQLNGGAYDYDAVTFDETNYAMTKVLALGRSMGLEMHPTAYQHGELSQLFDLIGAYHRLMAADRATGIVPPQVKAYLSQPQNEADLVVHGDTYQLVEKRVEDDYAVWSSGTAYSSSFDNRFGAQPLRVQIRPRPDYLPFADSSHLLLADLETAMPSPTAKGSGTTCTAGSGGALLIDNTGTNVGGCRLHIPGPFDMSFKRGVGLDVTGDSGNEVIVVSLHDNSVGARDFKRTVDFSGRQTIILGDPTGDLVDAVPGFPNPAVGTWGYSKGKFRHWDFDYAKVQSADIFVLAPPGSHTLTFHSLKALQEKSGGLVNPTITIGTQSITFPVSLGLFDDAANILEYDGRTGQYRVLTGEHDVVSTGTVSQPAPSVASGNNTLQVSSDLSSAANLARADVRISTYDDEDGDGIPTNGDYDPAYHPCSGQSSFCDDNCPNTPNPDQTDSNGDGIGDACQ